MAVKHLEVSGVGQISIYKRHNARSIKITILPNGGVRVTIPSWAPYRAGLEYAKSKTNWILEHQRVPTKLRNGQLIGKFHRLMLMPIDTHTYKTRLTETEIRIYYPIYLSSNSKPVQTKAREVCERALRHEATKLLPQRLRQLAVKYNYAYDGVSVKKLKSRWGSCNHKKHITLNLFLMQLSWQLIDYVLVHELNHTRHLNHSPAFWQEMEEHLPRAKALRRQLRAYQPSL